MTSGCRTQARLLGLLLLAGTTIINLWWMFLRSPVSHPREASSGVLSSATQIWQIAFEPDQKTADLAQAWRDTNPASPYTLLTRETADLIVATEYVQRPDVLQVWQAIRPRVLLSDYLRYLVLGARGGVYTDLDTIPLRPIETWIPQRFRSKARVAIGLEFDQRQSTDPSDHGSMQWNGMTFPVQLCQWTIYSSARHPLLQAMVDQVTHELRLQASIAGVELSDLELSDRDVARITGPAAWTRLILHHLSSTTSGFTWRNLSGIADPVLFGDILILPINAFGSGQEHSGSAVDGAADDSANVRHLFHGFWKHSSDI